MKKVFVLSMLLVAVLIFSACAPMAPAAPEAAEEPMVDPTSEPVSEVSSMEESMGDIVDTAIAAGSFETLVAAVTAAGLVDTLKSEGPFTVFAPTDDAFAALPEGTVETLLEDPQGALTDILLYHVVSGKVMASDVVGLDGQEVETINGAPIAVSVDGDNVMINEATVVTADIETSNGVIHVIDSVILPPADEEAEEAEADPAAGEEMSDIVETAIAAGSFETLVAAVSAAGLVDTLKGEGPFTVFAPTDDAFAALPEGTVESLLEDPEGALTDILLYHVVAGKVMAADVVGLDGEEVATVNGASISISVDGDNVMINDATVVTADVEASNGVIHVIDSVILPPTE